MGFYSVFESVDRVIRGTVVGRHADDVYLASFPKSGNTWLRFVLGNLKVLVDKLNIEVDFHTINSLIPDVQLDRRLSMHRTSTVYPRIIKTHFPYASCYSGKAIYLYRNPQDVMVSYYYYLVDGKSKKFDSFSSFIRHERYGVYAWVRHSISWSDLEVCSIGYESMKADPVAKIHYILDYLGLKINDELISEAIANSSFEKMKELEQERGDPYAKNGVYEFVRKEGSNYKDMWNKQEDLDFLYNTAGTLMRKLGYEMQ